MSPANHADGQLDAVEPAGVAGHGGGPGAGVGHRRDLDRLLVERGRAVVRAGAADRRRREVTVDGLAVQQPASSARPSVDDVRSAEQRAGGEQRLGQHGVGVGSRGSGHGQPASAPSGPIVVDGVGEQRRGAVGGAGRRRAPRRRRGRRRPSPGGHGERCSTPCSKYDERALAHPVARAPGAAAVPKRPDAPTPAVLDAAAVRPAARRPTAGSGSGRSTPWASARNRNAVAAELDAPAWLGVGSRGDDDQQAGHVVGAVAVARAGARRGRRARTCRCRRSSRAMWSNDGRAVRSCPHAVVAAAQRAGSAELVRTGPRPRSTPARAPGGGPRRPCRRPGRGRSSTRRMRGGQRRGSRWGTTSPAPLASSSTAWGKAVDTTGRPAATASTSTPEVTWSARVVGQHDHVGRADQLGQRGEVAVGGVEVTPCGATPELHARLIEHLAVGLARAGEHLRVGGAGDDVAAAGVEVARAGRPRRWPTRCPCPARAGPR